MPLHRQPAVIPHRQCSRWRLTPLTHRLLSPHDGHRTDVDEETWDAARSVGVETNLTLDALNLLASLAYLAMGARSGFVIARGIGFTLSHAAVSVLGAVMSTGDFVYTMLTKHPNRKGLESVEAILEGKEQAAKVWQVLFSQWLTLPDSGRLTEEQIQSREEKLDADLQAMLQSGVGDAADDPLCH